MKLTLNLDNFMNTTFEISEDLPKVDQYAELLEWLEDWIPYTKFALSLANHVRTLLGLLPNTASSEPVPEPDIKKLPKNTKKAPANGKYKVSTTLCNKCQGYISWDGWSQGALPTHVDGKGNILNNGDCPNA